MFFGFTQCPDVCPTTLATLAQMKKKLADLPAEQQPRVLLVSVDPERDTAAILKPYVTFFDPSFLGATGTLAATGQAARAFSVPFAKVPLPGGGYTMDHGAGLFVVSPAGRARRLFVAAARCHRPGSRFPQGRAVLRGIAPMTGEIERSGSDKLFALLQGVLPQHLLSRGMHALARSRQPAVRNLVLRTVLRSYPQIDMHEALQPDPFTYESFNAFFTRELRPGARPIATDAHALVSPVDGTVSQLGRTTAGALLQAKGMQYTCAALLADVPAATRYHGGSFACLYLAPYNYHRIHMPCDAVLRATRYVPGQLFSVNAATARTVPDLFARNERVVCDFDTADGPLCLVLVGALFVGSIETVFAGEINPPPGRGGKVRAIESGVGRTFRRGEELARFNMGSTVIVLTGAAVAFAPRVEPGEPVRLGQVLARFGA